MVIWTPRAQSDLKAIHDYIAKDAPLNVKHIIQDIVRKADILLSFPKAGKKVIDIHNNNVREIHVHAWRIIYHLKNNDVYVLTVLHKRRNMEFDDMPLEH
jgi:toxin ParE1/3/4